jgi:Putative MetA-pathway of phenol degradation
MKKNIYQSLPVLLFLLFLGMPDTIQAQGDGARFYWKGLKGTNVIPVIGSSLGGNANPLDPSLKVFPGSNFNATMSMVGYSKMLSLSKRSAFISVIVPMGRISSEMSFNGLDYNKTARGYGDPTVLFDLNVIGPKANMNLPDMLRYKPGFSVDLTTSLTIPIGEYDNSSPINIGQNRWYGRIGAPVVWQLGAWVPGKRTTLEFLPAIWIYGDNNDFVGKTIETDPMFQLEAHLTRDFMERLWGSLDLISYSGGKATIDGVEGSALSNIGLGGTLGYQINDNMQVNISYSSTVNDTNSDDLKIDGFRVTLLYGWHPLVEGIRRLKSE